MSLIRVLHIDDEPDIRELAVISLDLDTEFEVRGCTSGKDELAATTESRPDLILLDVMMPFMDGPETLRHLQENPKTADIPVVFMWIGVGSPDVDRRAKLLIYLPVEELSSGASLHAG